MLDLITLNKLSQGLDYVKKEEHLFLKKYGLSDTVFYIGCLRFLKAINLSEFKFNELKGGLEKNDN